MCGIVGLFLKDEALQLRLGDLLSAMLVTMTDRGPDSAGLALYGPGSPDTARLTVQSAAPDEDFAGLQEMLTTAGVAASSVEVRSTHAVIELPERHLPAARTILRERRPGIRVMSAGAAIRIYKEVGLPADVVTRFAVQQFSGTHGVGHTRMATESAVTTLGAHPFSTGPDQCLVHNGSLSNHNNLRRELRRAGMTFETDNDSEVAAAYLTNAMAGGKSLGAALESALVDLDGFFTFVVGTRDGFGVVRDAIACKPAVMAETDRYVAFGSEFRALAGLPGIGAARVWEPEPAKVYFWEHRRAA